jgi:hypothetical protein
MIMGSSIVHVPWPPSFSPSTLSMPGYYLWAMVGAAPCFVS